MFRNIVMLPVMSTLITGVSVAMRVCRCLLCTVPVSTIEYHPEFAIEADLNRLVLRVMRIVDTIGNPLPFDSQRVSLRVPVEAMNTYSDVCVVRRIDVLLQRSFNIRVALVVAVHCRVDSVM